jgi:hypothetical protein
MTKREKERLEQLSNTLFGPPEDLSFDDVVETLKLSEIDPEELCDRTYQQLLLKARAYRARQEDVPALLKKALEDLRPANAPPRSQEELDRAASATVSRVVDAVRSLLRLPAKAPDFAVSASYRNKKSGESSKDQAIINGLEQELLKDLSGEDKTD